MPQVDTGWFQGRIADRRMSQRKLAALMGMDPGALSLALNGKRKLSAAEIAELARLLDVEVGEVLARAGVSGHRKARPEESGGEWEAEFMRKWLDLGLMLLKRGG